MFIFLKKNIFDDDEILDDRYDINILSIYWNIFKYYKDKLKSISIYIIGKI